MKKLWKYGVLPAVIFIFLLVVTVMLMPVLINVQKYVPEIEKSMSKAAGRPFSIGSDVAVSFFPWLSLSFSEMKLGNPPGFVSDALVKIDSFEARIKLLPILKKEIQISRFVVGGLEVNLEKNSEGKVNWEFLRSMASPPDFLQGSIFCTLLAVTDGRLNWIDRTNHTRHSVEDLMLLLNNVQPDRALALEFNASFDGKPIALEGELGPLLPKEGDRSFPVDIDFRLVEELQGRLQGKVDNWPSAPAYDVVVKLSSFSPRRLFSALDLSFPIKAAEPATFQAFELDLAAKGGRDSLSGKGTARLDDATLLFSGEVKKERELLFSLDIDRLDLDRYFVSPHRTNGASGIEEHPAMETMNDLLAGSSPLALAGSMSIGTLKVHGGTVSAVAADIGGRDGLFTVDKATMELFGGQLQANLAADLSGEMPRMKIAAQAQGIDTAAMLRDMSGPEFLAGTLASDMVLEFSGRTAGDMQQSLLGEASFAILDGTLPGMDLHQSMQVGKMVKAGSENDRQSVRTDFTEMKGRVTIDKGLLTIREATLSSSGTAMVIGGGADIPGRAWDLQVALPKPVKGKNEPLAISGTFGKPEIQNDSRPQPAIGATEPAKINVASLVDDKIPSPIDEDVKDLVGKPLIDPAIVAQRFHLQRETLRRSEMKKQLQLGSGKIRINPLLEETSR